MSRCWDQMPCRKFGGGVTLEASQNGRHPLDQSEVQVEHLARAGVLARGWVSSGDWRRVADPRYQKIDE